MMLTFKVLPSIDRATTMLLATTLLVVCANVAVYASNNNRNFLRNHNNSNSSFSGYGNDNHDASTHFFDYISTITMLLLSCGGMAAAAGFYSEIKRKEARTKTSSAEELKPAGATSTPSPKWTLRSAMASQNDATYATTPGTTPGKPILIKGGKKTKDEKHTVMALVLDRSGSMSVMGNEVEGGTNAYLDEQRKADIADGARTSIVLTTFDDTVEFLHNDVDLTSVSPITHAQVEPRGLTSLFDAIGETLVKTAEIVNALDMQPSVQIFILTDGHENTSSAWSQYHINDAIQKLKLPENGSWDFYFAAANQDAMAVGASLGMDADQCITYAGGSGAQMSSAMKQTHGCWQRSKRSGGRIKGFSADERASVM